MKPFRWSVIIAMVAGTFGMGIAHTAPPVKAQLLRHGAKPALVAHVTLSDFSIRLAQREWPAGKVVRLVIVNRGRVMHEVILERIGDEDRPLKVAGNVYEAENIKPGATRIVTWTVPRAGRYQLGCHISHHFKLGMKAVFTVR